MIKARNRKLALVLVLAMLMTMFAGLGTASAASITYSAVGSPVLSKGVNNQDIQLLIDISDAIVFSTTYDSKLTIQFPSNVELAGDPALQVTAKQGTGGLDTQTPTGDYAYVSAKQKSSRVVDLTVAAGSYRDEAKILLNFKGLTVKSGSGDLVVTLLAPSGSAFPNGNVTLGTISKGKIMIVGGTVKNIGDGAAEIDTITLAETAPGVFEPGEVITFELSKGFEWTHKGAAVGGWAFEGIDDGTLAAAGYVKQFTTAIDTSDKRRLTITLDDPGFVPGATAGRISLGSDLMAGLLPKIQATDEAKEGDVIVTVKSDKGLFEKTKIVVAKYGSYGAKVVEGTVKEILAGRTAQEIGEFYIEEDVAGSLIHNRTVILELPSGVKWAKDSNNDPVIEIDVEDGDDVFSGQSFSFVSGSDESAIKITVNNNNPTEASKILFKNAEVRVDPGVAGDIEITVRGTAGVEGTVKVAEAKLPVTITAKNVAKVVAGAPNQKVADIIIKESVAEGILDKANGNLIVVGLDAGFKFAKKPTVTVTEGDLDIDSTKLISDDTELQIKIKYSSTEPSTITISDVYVTAYRYVPEGDVKATLVEAKNYGTSSQSGSTALVDFDTDKSAGSTVIATVVTPAEAAAVGEFRIGSNVYYLNGIAKVMDVAPYIKNDRTYVPMRYLGEMLGAEVIWDDAARTVTLTKGDTTVVFTIGSTTYTVNGETKTADVAPEITNDRTMLPARFVAEAFGAVVGWDAASQTVLIQQ